MLAVAVLGVMVAGCAPVFFVSWFLMWIEKEATP